MEETTTSPMKDIWSRTAIADRINWTIEDNRSKIALGLIPRTPDSILRRIKVIPFKSKRQPLMISPKSDLLLFVTTTVTNNAATKLYPSSL